jgi:hypothetical protein
MNRVRRAAVLALLVYVTLDFAEPAFPGAFVFDPSGCVDVNRTSSVPAPHAVPGDARQGPWVPFRVVEVVDEIAHPNFRVRELMRPPSTALPRAALTAAPPAENPQ